jgi:hypothetical protein
MRKLTQHEIDQAPEWATSYFIYSGGQEIRWQDNIDHIFMWSHEGVKFPFPRDVFSRGESINRKPFDISEYEFSDCDIESVEIDGYADNEYLHFDFKQETNELTHSKGDVIAMAKALKLTAEDLK